MWPIFFLLFTVTVGITLRCHGATEKYSWLITCTIIPLVLLSENFLRQHIEGGASMLPIALALGSFYGALCGGIGVIIGSTHIKNKKANK